MSLTRIGDVKRAQATARRALRLQASLVIDRKRVETDKTNQQAQQAVAVGLDRIADLKLYASDHAGASPPTKRPGHKRRLAETDKTNGESERSVSVSFGRFAM